MKSLLAILGLTIGQLASAEITVSEHGSNSELLCSTVRDGYNGSTGISCVSKVSIEKDKLEIEKLKLEIELLNIQLKKESAPLQNPLVKKVK